MYEFYELVGCGFGQGGEPQPLPSNKSQIAVCVAVCVSVLSAIPCITYRFVCVIVCVSMCLNVSN